MFSKWLRRFRRTAGGKHAVCGLKCHICGRKIKLPDGDGFVDKQIRAYLKSQEICWDCHENVL